MDIFVFDIVLVKYMYVDLFMFNVNLLVLSQQYIFESSWFTISRSFILQQWLKEKLLSSA